ncbi:MAG: LuxR family transcriptional regulator [Rhodobacterales bacterium]|nr:MAG: LuxR family transcriptional regulator [Rhodobacterales bacterium]
MLEFLEAIYAADTTEQVWDTLTRKMDSYGFDRLFYAYTRFNLGAEHSDPADSLLLSSHSEDYTRRYINERHFSNGPMLRWSLHHNGACSWSWLQELEKTDSLTEAERKVLSFNHSFGVITGYTIGFKSDSARCRAGLGLTARLDLSQDEVDAIWAKSGREILVMCNMAHLKIISLPYCSKRRPLTKRQREVLEWVGEGKTMQDIATIMNLTTATVEKHLRLARQALGVETTAQAVLKASYQDQIFVI